MQILRKLVVTALAAAMLLAIGVTSATARSLRINERNFEVIWNTALGTPKTKLRFAAAGRPAVECQVTLLGRMRENTIVKEINRDQGTINHGELESCTNGTATIKTESFPWTVRYDRFTGRLPRIAGIDVTIISAKFRIREPGNLECEIRTEGSRPAGGIIGNSAEVAETGLELNGEPENVTAERGDRIPLGGEGLLCLIAGEGSLSGIGLIRNLPRTTKPRITLI